MKEKNPVISKIEIDEKTSEPKIVKATEKDLLEAPIQAEDNNLPDQPTKSQGEQLIMSKLLGFDNSDSINKRQKRLKNIVTVIFIVLVLGVLLLTAYHDFFSKEPPSLSHIANIIKNNWFYLLFAILSLILCFVFKGTKLSIMCKSITGKWHYKTCVETGIVGHYYNNVTPLAVGGQPFEIYHLSKNGVSGGAAASLPIASFFMQQFAFFVLGLLAIILYGTNAFELPKEIVGVMPTVISVVAIIGLIFSFLMPTIVVSFSLFPKISKALLRFVMFLGNKFKIVKDAENTTAKITNTLENNAKCLKQLASRPLVFTTAFLISIGEQLALCSIAYFTLRSFGFDWVSHNFKEWAQVIQLCIILYAAISFIPTPGNAGAADLSFYLLFDTGLMIGANKIGGLAFPAMMLWRILSFYSFIIVGFIFTNVNRKKHKSK